MPRSKTPAAYRQRSLRDRSPEDKPHRIDENDVGSTPIEDAAILPSGRMLAALGESGVRLSHANGGTIRDWPSVPAHRLVMADSGNVAVAMASRGRLWRLTRLDLTTGAATPWCDAEIPVFAPDSDGSLWMVALPAGGGAQSLAAIDLQGPPDRLASLWRTTPEAGAFRCITRTTTQCVTVSLDSEVEVQNSSASHEPPTRLLQWERRIFEMPTLTMRDRYSWIGGRYSVAHDGAAARGKLHSRWWQAGADPSLGGVIVERRPEQPASPSSAGIPSKSMTLQLHLQRGRLGPPRELSSDVVDRSLAPGPPVLGHGWMADNVCAVGGKPTVVVL